MYELLKQELDKDKVFEYGSKIVTVKGERVSAIELRLAIEKGIEKNLRIPLKLIFNF